MNNNPDDFGIDGLDELDTQMKLYQMGVESFSPYAGSGKIDMIIRSDNGEIARYADIKVCSAKKDDENVIWKLEVSFIMKNDSFIILPVRIPDDDGTMIKNHFVMNSENFLQIAKECDLKVQNDTWVISIPYKDLLVLMKSTKKKFTTPLAKLLKDYFNNWNLILDWSKID